MSNIFEIKKVREGLHLFQNRIKITKDTYQNISNEVKKRNYSNFYKDLEVLGIRLNVDKILAYLKFKNENVFDKLDTVNKNYKLLLYDNFNNEYNVDSNYLTWNPELKL